jgi:hypothetical protein
MDEKMKSSIGPHTFALYKRLFMEDEGELYNNFNDCMKHNKGQMKRSEVKNKKGQTIEIYSYKNRIGIRWLVMNMPVKDGFGNTFSIIGVMAIITPEVLLNNKDYIAITTMSDIQKIKAAFNDEARKISPILGNFDLYSVSRVDYCGNFFLDELKNPCTPKRMMKLIKMGDIPTHYVERTEYNRKKTTHRKETDPTSFYLVSGSVVVNCYDKYAQLEKNKKHPCPNIEAAKNLIRFEIQCKNQKLHAMSKNFMCVASEPEPSTSTFSNEEEMDEFYKELSDIMTRRRIAPPIDAFLSNAICVEVIDKYFRKIVRSGDYYTLDQARYMIKMSRFHPKREEKLINALEMTNANRGIHKTKSRLTGNDLVEYKRMLIDLDKLGINPVTIPRAWGIEHIPNLLNTYHNKRAEEYNDERRRESEKTLFMKKDKNL